MLDCSLRDSKMGPNETAEGHTADMQIGEQLTCYVIKVINASGISVWEVSARSGQPHDAR